METNNEQLLHKIQSLDTAQTSDSVRNLRLSLAHHWQQQVTDEDAAEILKQTAVAGTSELPALMTVDDQDPAGLERWGKALLLFCAEDPALRDHVSEAVDDALESTVKDFGLSSLIVVGVVLVLLKYRPAKIEVGDKKFKAEWKENDVSIIRDLAKLIVPNYLPKKDDDGQ